VPPLSGLSGPQVPTLINARHKADSRSILANAQIGGNSSDNRRSAVGLDNTATSKTPMTPEAAEEQSTITGGFFTANDRYGEFDLLVGCICAQITDDSFSLGL